MLDDQLLADRHRQFSARRQRPERAAELFALECHPRRDAAALRHLDCLDDHLLGATRLGHADYTANLDQRRGNRDFPAVDLNMPVANHLARLRQRAGEAETIHHVVKPPLEQHQQVLAGNSVHPLSHLEAGRELRFHQTVDALDLLLFTQSNREFRKTRARLTVRSGWIIAPLDRALVAVASLSLEEEFQSFAPAQSAYRTQIPCHRRLRLFHSRVSHHFTFHFSLFTASGDQTLRRFGGRHPLCGIGVTSLIEMTPSPAACSARTADSRPPPGPLTCTTTARIPTSEHLRAHASAAICAAKGVPLREPLKPTDP